MRRRADLELSVPAQRDTCTTQRCPRPSNFWAAAANHSWSRSRGLTWHRPMSSSTTRTPLTGDRSQSGSRTLSSPTQSNDVEIGDRSLPVSPSALCDGNGDLRYSPRIPTGRAQPGLNGLKAPWMITRTLQYRMVMVYAGQLYSQEQVQHYLDAIAGLEAANPDCHVTCRRQVLMTLGDGGAGCAFGLASRGFSGRSPPCE